MRDIKFQFLYKGAPFHGGTKEFNWHKKVYSLDQLISTKLSNLCDVHNTSTLIAKRQFTGLKDKNGVEIYEGDILGLDNIDNRNEYHTYSVLYSPEKASFLCADGVEISNINDVVNHSDSGGEYEVIGNIYQNPELIENNNE